jgi:hypothetical protein
VSLCLCGPFGEEKTKGYVLCDGVFMSLCVEFGTLVIVLCVKETVVEIAPVLFGSVVEPLRTGEMRGWSHCSVGPLPVVESDSDARNARLGDVGSSFCADGATFGIGDVACAESTFGRNCGAQ